ncbi:MAG: DUF402 domain-containing protein [Chloroflexota bacterium]|nr:DUF402 domain-containing protein [Chloroflexota bacterium]
MSISESQPAWTALAGLRRIQVLALNYARKPHRRWTGWVLADSPACVAVYRPPQAAVLLRDTHTWLTQAPAVCLFWPDRYYNLSYLLDAESQVQGYYVDVTTAPVRRAGYLEYVGLDLGVLVGPDLAYTVDSEDTAMAYPPALQAQAHSALQSVISLIEAHDPLFSPPQAWLAVLDDADRDSLDTIAAMLRGPLSCAIMTLLTTGLL